MPAKKDGDKETGVEEGKADRRREEFLESVAEPEPARAEGSAQTSSQAAGAPRAAVVSEVGVVALNGRAIRVIAGSLRDRMAKDPQLKARFMNNPREVLGSVGFNEEIQSEMLRVDRDFAGSPFGQGRLEDWCITTSCCCTSCCVSCWFSF